MAARDKNGIYLAEETYNEITLKMDSQNRELNEKVLLIKALKDELASKEKIFNEVSLNLVEKKEELNEIENDLKETTGARIETNKDLDSTKRRHKENKLLLESHVKTEETLKKQATQILEEADIATKDTEELHKTADRRKVVDVKIQTACERFSERMKDKFELLNDNLKQVETQQQSCSQDVVEELREITFAQLNVFKNIKKELDDIDSLITQSLADFSSLEGSFKNCLKNSSEEQKAFVFQMIEELKVEKVNFQQQIKDSISSILTYNEQQKCSLHSMREKITATLNANNAQIEKQIEEINNTMCYYKQKSLENLQVLQKIPSDLNKKQKSMEEFQSNMMAFQIDRFKYLEDFRSDVEWLENNQREIIARSESSQAGNQEFLSKQTHDNKNNCSLIENLTSEAELYIDQSVGKCSTIYVQLDNLLEGLKQAEEISNALKKYDKDLIDTAQQYENNCKRLRAENYAKIKANIEKIYHSLDDHEKKLKNHLHTLKDSNVSVQNSVRDYAELYKRHMNQCVSDLESFRRSE